MKRDVIIIGAGPIGLSCGIEAKRNNLSHLIIEKGCLVNSIYQYPTNMTFFSTSERLEIGDVPFISHGPKPTRKEALEYYRRVKESWGLEANVYEAVTSINQNSNGAFSVATNKNSYEADYVVIATGFFTKPNLMNVPGEDLPKTIHYYDEPHPYAYQKVLVVGAGNSAVDVALETYRKGSEVTMVVRESKLKDGVKYWVKPDIENRIKEGAIKAYFNSSVLEIKEISVTIQTPEGVKEIPNDFVLAMTGYHSDFDFLEGSGVRLSNDDQCKPNYDEITFETNVKGLYLAGVVCSGLDTSGWFIENSRYHAENILKDILKKKKAGV